MVLTHVNTREVFVYLTSAVTVHTRVPDPMTKTCGSQTLGLSESLLVPYTAFGTKVPRTTYSHILLSFRVWYRSINTEINCRIGTGTESDTVS